MECGGGGRKRGMEVGGEGSVGGKGEGREKEISINLGVY